MTETTKNIKAEMQLAISKGIFKFQQSKLAKLSDEEAEELYEGAYALTMRARKGSALVKIVLHHVPKLLENFGKIHSAAELKEDLETDEALVEDLDYWCSKVAPYIPLAGIASGAVTIGVHISEKSNAPSENYGDSDQGDDIECEMEFQENYVHKKEREGKSCGPDVTNGQEPAPLPVRDLSPVRKDPKEEADETGDGGDSD